MLVHRNHHQTASLSKPRLKFNEETPGVTDHLPPTSHTKASSAALDFFLLLSSSKFLARLSRPQLSPTQPSPARVIGLIEPFTSFLFEIITVHLINLPSVFIMLR